MSLTFTSKLTPQRGTEDTPGLSLSAQLMFHYMFLLLLSSSHSWLCFKWTQTQNTWSVRAIALKVASS